MKSHIAVDFDDVLCDFMGGILETVNRDFDVNLTKADVKDWDWSPMLDAVIGRSWWDWLRDRVTIWGEKFKPIPGALGALEMLHWQGHYVEIVTSKPDWARRALWTWLSRYEPYADRVTIVPLHEEKTDWSDADVLVDDKWANCLEWAKDGRTAILFPASHNEGQADGGFGIVRATNWSHVLRLIDEMEVSR